MKHILTKVAKSLNQKTLQEYSADTKETQTQDQTKKYQDIEYCLCNGGRSVYHSERKKTDLQKALYETRNLDWTFSKNGISFINNRTGESVFLRRTSINNWYIDTAIKPEKFTNFWASNIDGESIQNILELFFEEVDWFGTIRWVESPDPFEGA